MYYFKNIIGRKNKNEKFKIVRLLFNSFINRFVNNKLTPILCLMQRYKDKELIHSFKRIELCMNAIVTALYLWSCLYRSYVALKNLFIHDFNSIRKTPNNFLCSLH